MKDVLLDAQKLLADHKFEEAAHLCFAQAQASADLAESKALIARGVELLQAVPVAHRAKLLNWKHTPTRIFVSDWRNPSPDQDVLARVDYAQYLLEKCLEIEKAYPNCEITGSFDALLRAYWWNGEFFLRAGKPLEAAERKGRALKMVAEASPEQQRAFSREFEDEYKMAWKSMVLPEWVPTSEQYLLDLKAFRDIQELSEECPKSMIEAMAFINDFSYWDALTDIKPQEQEALAKEARQRLVSGKCAQAVIAALVERVLQGADLKPSYTHYILLNQVNEEDVYAGAKREFLHRYSNLDPNAWEDLIRKWHHTLGKAKLPSYHEFVVDREDMRNIARRYLMRQIITTRSNNWEKFHEEKLKLLALSPDEVKHMLLRTEKQKKSDIEQLFEDLPDCEQRIENAFRIEQKEEEFKQFNEWSSELTKRLQSLWQAEAADLGGLHFLLAVDNDDVPRLEKISAADLYRMRPKEEAERALTEKLEEIISKLKDDPLFKEQGGAAIWVQLTA